MHFIEEIIDPELTFLSKTTKNLVNIAFARFSILYAYNKCRVSAGKACCTAPVQLHLKITDAPETKTVLEKALFVYISLSVKI